LKEIALRLGWLEILVILGVVLLFFGPTRLPNLGNALGAALRNFKRGLSGGEEPPPDKRELPPSDPTPKA
jgi:sec-independent protein translocase protein TatA